MKLINVLIITYNQQGVIGRTLDCVLEQKDYGLHEIIVCDDCSRDKTWDVLQDYQNKYPTIVKPYRNSNNLGIYGNQQKLVSLRGSADLFYFLSGDDLIHTDTFKTLQGYLESNNISLYQKAVAIYGDWLRIFPDGRKDYMSNGLIESGLPALSLKIRGQIFNWGVFLSKELINSFGEIVLDKGVPLAEGLFDIQTQRYASENYHIPSPFGVYSAEVGVSTKMNGSSYLQKELIAWQYFKNLDCFSSSDKQWIRYKEYQIQLLLHGGLNNYCKSISSFFGSKPRLYKFSMRYCINVVYLLTRQYLSYYYHLVQRKGFHE